MSTQEFVSVTMDMISAIKEYREKYGEEGVVAYYKTHGTYEGIEEYLKNCIAKNES